jgi:hypothetical protein
LSRGQLEIKPKLYGSLFFAIRKDGRDKSGISTWIQPDEAQMILTGFASDPLYFIRFGVLHKNHLFVGVYQPTR